METLEVRADHYEKTVKHECKDIRIVYGDDFGQFVHNFF